MYMIFVYQSGSLHEESRGIRELPAGALLFPPNPSTIMQQIVRGIGCVMTASQFCPLLSLVECSVIHSTLEQATEAPLSIVPYPPPSFQTRLITHAFL